MALPQESNRIFDNNYDENTTVMHMLVRPTVQDILDLPNHTEVLCVWPDGEVDGYDVDEAFKVNMRLSLGASGQPADTWSGVLVVAAVTPDKMHPDIRAALEAKGR